MIARHGWVEVICGCMFSGKTEELIRRMQRAKIARQKVQIFKPGIDDRYSKDHVASHNQTKLPSMVVSSAFEIIEKLDDTTRVVGIDEAQFFDDDIALVVDRLANRGLRVVVAGLDMDFRGKPFGPMPQLMAIAEQVTKLTAVCVVCGDAATRTQRNVSSEDQVLVGAKGLYEARCRDHHFIPKADEVEVRSRREIPPEVRA